MKKSLSIVCILLIHNFGISQIELWGLSRMGGEYQAGSIYKANSDGSSLNIEHDFYDIKNGGGPSSNLLQLDNGNVIGTTAVGGENNYGVLFEYNPITHKYTKKIEFDGDFIGYGMHCGLSFAADGKIYGVTISGSNDMGIIFQYDPVNAVLVKKLEFEVLVNLTNPISPMIQAIDGLFYGITETGGINDHGILFKYDPQANIYTKLVDFEQTTSGKYPAGSLVEFSDGKLYGATDEGGVNGKGNLFCFNPSTNLISSVWDFDYGSDGWHPNGSMLLASDGLLYGTTESGGTGSDGGLFSFGAGVLFQYNPLTNSYSKKFDFDIEANGDRPNGTLIEAVNGMVYGTTARGMQGKEGLLFQYDIENNVLSPLAFFEELYSSFLSGNIVVSQDQKIIGVRTEGGLANRGSIFEYDIQNGILDIPYYFDVVINGTNPLGALIQYSEGKLYGVTIQGGANNAGVIFQFDPQTNTYKDVYHFEGGINGELPLDGLVQANDGMLYGTTVKGGVYGQGTLFQYDPVNNVFCKKLDFKDTLYGSYPHATLINGQDGNLYGITGSGGINNGGVLFQYKPGLDVFTKKYTLDALTQGAISMSKLLQASNGKLYGINSQGGTHQNGTLFEFDLVNSTFTKILDFDAISNGGPSESGLTEAENGLIYGITGYGGSDHKGTLFQLDPSNNSFTTIHTFTDTVNGYFPSGTLLSASDGNLYGITRGGGVNDAGTLFQIDISTNSISKKLDFTTSVGSPVSSLIEIDLTIGAIEDLLYPNPSNGEFLIDLKSKCEVTVSNFSGKIALHTAFQAGGKQAINLQNGDCGIYFVKISYPDGKTVIKKIVIL